MPCFLVPCSLVPCSLVQCSLVPCSLVPCSLVPCSLVLCFLVQCSLVQCCTPVSSVLQGLLASTLHPEAPLHAHMVLCVYGALLQLPREPPLLALHVFVAGFVLPAELVEPVAAAFAELYRRGGGEGLQARGRGSFDMNDATLAHSTRVVHAARCDMGPVPCLAMPCTMPC